MVILLASSYTIAYFALFLFVVASEAFVEESGSETEDEADVAKDVPQTLVVEGEYTHSIAAYNIDIKSDAFLKKIWMAY